MKKNLLTIVILALLIVNLILTSIMMFSVMNTNKKTGAVVSDIAAILQIELGGDAEASSHQVSLEDTATFDLSEDLTISLGGGADDKDHFAVVNISISMDTKSDGYKKFGENIADRESLIIGVVTDVISRYSIDELKVESIKEQIREEILKGLQQKFDGSDFIYDVTFTKLIPS